MSQTYEISVQGELNVLYQDIKKAINAKRSVEVVVKSTASKTQDQLGYYWAVILPRVREAMKEQGNDHLSLEDVNQILNEKFYCVTKTVSWVSGKGNDRIINTHIMRKAKSKSGAKKDEMSEFLGKVIRFAEIDLGIFIPEPDTVPA